MSALASEWKIVAREPIVRWTVLILLLLSLLAMWNGSRFAAQRAADAQAEVTRSLEKRETARETLLREAADPSSANPWGPSEPTRADWNASRPPGPLAALSFGREDLEPVSATVSLWMVRTDNLFRKYEFASPVALAVGRFDAGFLIVLILPLFMLTLGYNVVAEERESGRLRLAELQGRGVGKRLFARLLLRQAPVYLVILLLAIWALATLGLSLRLAVWIGASLAYLLFWTGVTALIASLRQRAELLALAAAAMWLAVVVLLPAGGAVLSRIVQPTPSQIALINEAREASLEANRRLLENLQSYVSDHPELATGDASDDDWAAKLYVSQLVIEEGLSDVLAAQRAAQDRQAHLSELLRFVSPASTVDHAMIESAGTGRARQAAYVGQVTQFLQDWRAELSPLIFRGQRLVADDIAGLPRFRFVEPPMPASVFASLLFITTLAVVALLLGYRCIAATGSNGAASQREQDIPASVEARA